MHTVESRLPTDEKRSTILFVLSGFASSPLGRLPVFAIVCASACGSEPASTTGSSRTVPVPVLDPGGRCTGETPPASAWQAKPGPTRADGGVNPNGTEAGILDAGLPNPAADGSTADGDSRTIGAAFARYSLRDVQPLSCGYGATYGLDIHTSKVVVVVLLAGWCGFCRAQALKLEQMRIELERESSDLRLVIVNKSDASDSVAELTRRTASPVLQDLPEVDAWTRHGGMKDDFFIYGRDGRLADYLPMGGPRDLNLSTDAGYDTVKGAIRAVLSKR
jgi:thiol-disulfide isomerase/thioredoxin